MALIIIGTVVFVLWRRSVPYSTLQNLKFFSPLQELVIGIISSLLPDGAARRAAIRDTWLRYGENKGYYVGT